MSTSYFTILVFIYLSGITCQNINITSLIPSSYFSSGMNNMVNEVNKIVLAVEKMHFGKASFITIILPTLDENTIMPQIMDKIAQQLGTKWLITTNDSCCCDSYEPRVLNPEKPTVIEYTADFYIIPLRNHKELNYLDAQLNLMSEMFSFNPRAVFVLLTLTNQCGGNYKDNHKANLYFDEMWKKNCMSSIILVLSECDFKITVITATPFSENNMCRKVQVNGTKQHISKWHEEGIDIGIYKNNNKNFNKCLFTVGAILQPPYVVGKPYKSANETHYEFVGGIDLDLLQLVATIYNFTYEFDVHHGYDINAVGRFLPNGSLVGMFIDVLLRNLDISLGGIIPNDYNYFRYDYSGYYRFSYFGWAVSDAGLAPQWKIFFGAFSQDVWIIFGLVFLLTSCLYSFLNHFVSSCFYEKHQDWVRNTIFYCSFQEMPIIQYFSITLGLSSILKPKSPCLRVLYFSWSVYSLHMCIAYSSMLFLLISNPPLEKEIRTVEDLHNSGLKVSSKLVVFQRFTRTDLDSTTRNILDNSVDCSNWEYCTADLKNNRNFSLLIMQDILEYYIDIKKSKVHRISEEFFSYGAAIMTSKGSPLDPGFDKVVLLAFESGLVEKWFSDTKSKFSKANNKDGSTVKDKSASILAISDLKGTFFIFVVGIVTSSLLLVGELTISFLQK